MRTQEGWAYLAVLLDLYSRKVVGWSTSASLDTSVCLQPLKRAVETRHPGVGLLHHSDRGSQYASRQYQERLETLGFRCSMSRKGNCYDNAVVESFFDTLKTECLDGAWSSRAELHDATARYIEGFYNLRRQHSFLGYIGPAEYEVKAA